MAKIRIICAALKPTATSLSIALGLGVALFGVAPTAQADPNFSISGLYEQYCCNWPNGGAPSFITPTKTNVTNRINDFPFAGGGGGVTIRFGMDKPVGPYAGVTITTNGNMIFPEGAVRGFGSFVDTSPGFPGWITLATALNFKNAAGTMSSGGQTGSASYCLNAAANPNCTDPANGVFSPITGSNPTPPAFNGRLAYVAGSNTYGGTMRILGGTPGFIRRTQNAGSQIILGPFAAPLSQIGGPFSEYKPETNTAFTWPATLPATNTTTATTTAKAYVVFAGIPWGTGVIYAGRTGGTGAVPTQSISSSGSNNVNTATATSGGNFGTISLVAASMSGRAAGNVFPVFVKLGLTVPEPGTTTLFACGAGLLGVLALRRRRAGRG